MLDLLVLVKVFPKLVLLIEEFLKAFYQVLVAREFFYAKTCYLNQWRQFLQTMVHSLIIMIIGCET